MQSHSSHFTFLVKMALDCGRNTTGLAFITTQEFLVTYCLTFVFFIPHRQIYKMHFNLFVCVPMAEKKVQKTKVQSDYLSDSETSEEEVNPQLHMSEEKRIYGMINGSA